MLTRWLAFLIACGILVGSAAVHHGLARDSRQLETAAERIVEVPFVIGEWQGTALPSDEKDERAFQQAGARAYWVRRYVHQQTRAAVTVILMCGRSGKMAVHTPEVCYGGAGFELQQKATVFNPWAETVSNDRASMEDSDPVAASRLWTAQFTKQALPPTSLRLYWGWNSTGPWEASPSPRWLYRGEPFLYKLYVSHDLDSLEHANPHGDPAADLLRLLLPQMNRTLFADNLRTYTPPSKN